MTSTEIAVAEPGGFLALTQTTEEIRDVVAANLGGSEVNEFDLTRLTVPAGGGTAWELETLGQTSHVSEVTGIIVHKKQTRGFWALPLGDGESGPPACSSPDAVSGYGKQWATPEDPDPDGEPRTLACRECPQSQFGSGKNGGQACQEKANWFMLGQRGFLPLVVTLPAMSLRPAKKYLLDLAGVGLRFDQVVTRLTLEKVSSGKNPYSKVIPTLEARLSDDEAERARAYAAVLGPIFERAAQRNGTPEA